MSQKTDAGRIALRERMLPVGRGGLIVLLVFLAYLPALHGGFIWDDDAWTTNLSALFQNASGLRSIWFHPTVLQQYYPLSGTTFWLDYQLWKFWTTPYHVENILLHALAALLFWRLLLRLQLPGAWLGGALFALHPVMVESAAWITERKNVLSLALYLGALLAYLRYARGGSGGTCQPVKVPPGRTKAGNSTPDPRPSAFFYGLAFILFLGALLSKTTTFSLPAVILLLGWWQRGQIRWRADVLPTLPFFALSFGLCAVTAWLEKNHVGAQGPDFALTFPQRCLIAGHAFWFYLGNLFRPAKLCFVYPRWQPDAGVWWQWLYPVTAIGALLTLWFARRRLGRGPVTALLFYVGTLFPVLGFMNAYGMRYAFVWDHWVYLPALGIIALVAALVGWVAESRRKVALEYGFAAIALPLLALLTWRQAGMYRDMETLWRTTLARNPDCWMACNNLGIVLAAEGRLDEAITNYNQAIRIKPDYSDALNNLSIALAAKGRLKEATENHLKAAEISPNNPEVLDNLGTALADQGRLDEAIENFRKAIQIDPNFSEALCNLGAALNAQGQFDEAIERLRQALQINPNNADARYNLGNALAAKRQFDEAITNYRQAVQINTNFFDALNNLGIALTDEGRFDEAIENYNQALRINPNSADALNNLGIALTSKGQFEDAIKNYRKALQINPKFSNALESLAVALTLQGQFDEAIEDFRQALQINPHRPETIFHLGLALGQSGRTREAVAQYREALKLNPDLAGALNNLAWILATSPDDTLRDGVEAVSLAERACKLTHNDNPSFLETLAAAYAETGRFQEAVTAVEKAAQLATRMGLTFEAGKDQQWRELYWDGKPYHEPAPTAH